jgi:anti-sigma B factor antagonist
MTDDHLRVQAECRNGLCVLYVAGELDMTTADEFADRADAAVQGMYSPVAFDLSDLTFIDACGGRTLAAVIRTLSAGRAGVIRSCPRYIRHVFDLLELPMRYLSSGDDLPLRPLSALGRIPPDSESRELVNRVRRARLDASETKLDASGMLAMLVDTSIRLADTLEQTDMIREQGRRTLASSRAAREHVMRSRATTAATVTG